MAPSSRSLAQVKTGHSLSPPALANPTDCTELWEVCLEKLFWPEQTLTPSCEKGAWLGRREAAGRKVRARASAGQRAGRCGQGFLPQVVLGSHVPIM